MHCGSDKFKLTWNPGLVHSNGYNELFPTLCEHVFTNTSITILWIQLLICTDLKHKTASAFAIFKLVSDEPLSKKVFLRIECQQKYSINWSK